MQRPRRFRYWATPAFWLRLTMGVVGSAVMLLLAPIAAWAYGQPILIGLIAVSAIALPIQALQVVPEASSRRSCVFAQWCLWNVVGRSDRRTDGHRELSPLARMHL